MNWRSVLLKTRFRRCAYACLQGADALEQVLPVSTAGGAKKIAEAEEAFEKFLLSSAHAEIARLKAEVSKSVEETSKLVAEEAEKCAFSRRHTRDETHPLRRRAGGALPHSNRVYV